MNAKEPTRFKEMNEPLDNFADLANRTVIKQKGLFSEPLGFAVKTEVKIGNLDDLVLVSEQDYYLNRILKKKFIYLQAEPELLEAALRLTEIYLTAVPYNGPRAESAKRFALSNLNLI